MAVSSSLNKKEIENLARQFNKTFGHAMMYGVKHQMTADSIKPFFTVLAVSLEKNPLITITIENESILLEGSNIDKMVNAKKLVAHFKKVGLQSFSFERGLLETALAAFMDVAADANKYPQVEAMKNDLAKRGVKGIRLNYVVYRKMTTDEEVIQKGMTVVPAGAGAGTGLRPGATGGLSPSDSVSLAKMLRDPKAVAGSLFYTSPNGVPPQPNNVVANVAMLGNQIREAAASGQAQSGNLMEAVLALREECMGHISDFKNAGLVGQDMDAVVNEVEKLSHDTIIYLVREEYKSGNISVKRLAQILRRMLPDHRELRELLPQLKDALLGAGMPFVKYIELVNELQHELEGDDVVATLAAATREMGVTPDEVIEEIKKHPADAARLMILSSELRRSGGGNEAGFEQVLTDYIEKVSQQMAVGSAEAANVEGGKQLGSVLQKIESNLLDNLKKQGIEQSVLTVLSARLAERLPFLLDTTKTEWLRKTLDSQTNLDTGMLAKLLAGTVQQAVEIDTHRDTLFMLFQQKGLSQEQIQEVLHQATQKVLASSQQIELPRGVLSSSAIMYFLERECKLSLRYHNPFSLLIISIMRLLDGSAQRELSAEERSLFMKALITTLKGIMRDIDMIGVPSSATESIVFVILPMTSESKTYGLVERLRRELSEHIFSAGAYNARLSLAISISGFDSQSMPDKAAFLKVAMAHHRAAEKIMIAGISEYV
jgi:GGDEF domain-containing protein